MRVQNLTILRSLTLSLVIAGSAVLAWGQDIPLSGKITNILGQPIPGVTIVIESDNSVRKIKTDKDGKFAAWGFVDAIYRIYTEDWVGELNYTDKLYMPENHKSYFRPTHRGGILLGPKAGPAKINMILVETAAVVADFDPVTNQIRSGNGLRYSTIAPHSKMKYQILMDAGVQIAHDLVIRYGIRVEKGDENIYTTPIVIDQPTVFGPIFPGVVISHDRTTVYCEKAAYDRKKKTIFLSGVIFVEDKNGVAKYTSGKIQISGPLPVFSFSK